MPPTGGSRAGPRIRTATATPRGTATIGRRSGYGKPRWWPEASRDSHPGGGDEPRGPSPTAQAGPQGEDGDPPARDARPNADDRSAVDALDAVVTRGGVATHPTVAAPPLAAARPHVPARATTIFFVGRPKLRSSTFAPHQVWGGRTPPYGYGPAENKFGGNFFVRQMTLYYVLG